MHWERLEKDLRWSGFVVGQNLEHKMDWNHLVKNLVCTGFLVGQDLE
jgi:hypothetical protein